MLINKADSHQYDSFFWEAYINKFVFKIDEGFVIKRDELTKFLEDKLYYLGAPGCGITAFIQFWLSHLQHCEYSFIKFISEEYENVSKLEVQPTPDCVIRIFFTCSKCQRTNSPPVQDLTPLNKERQSFNVIKQGVTDIMVDTTHIN